MINGLNLGDVGFSLGADTEGLERALATLRTFGEAVNKWAAKTEEGADTVTAAYARQERAMVSLYQRLTNLQAQAARIGAPSNIADGATKSLQGYIDTLAKADRFGNPIQRDAVEMQRALAAANSEVLRVSNALKDYQVQAAAAAKSQALLNKEAQLINAGRIQQAISNINPTTGLKAADSAKVFASAGLMDNPADAHVTAYQKEQAAIAKLTDSYNARANAHVAAYQKEQANLTALTTAINASANAHVLAYRKEQAAIEALMVKQVEQLNTQVRRVRGVDPQFAVQNTANLSAYQNAVSLGNASESTAALAKLKQGLSDTGDAVANAKAKTSMFVTALRDMERATIIAAGPLSGVGARMAVLAALFESNGVKAAMAVAGFAAFGTGLGYLTKGMIEAQIQWEKWTGLLVAGTGSIALVADEFEYATKVANKYGVSIQSLIPAYGSFAASARLSGMALADQHKVFEAVTTAGASLRWNSEQVGRAFLALEQMMSKGTVQTQELKLQMGQVLPGAFELAALAIGKTQSQLSQMLQKGELLSTEFLPKFADYINKVYSTSAAFGSQSVQAEIGRFDTSKFQFAKQLNDAIKAGDAFKDVLKGINATLSFLAEHSKETISVFIAGATSLITLFLPGILKGLVSIGSALLKLTVFAADLNLVLGSSVLGVIAKLVLMAAAGYAAYKGINSLLTDVNSATSKQIALIGESIQRYQEMGSISSREKKAMLENIDKQLKALSDQEKAIINQAIATDQAAQSALNLASAWTTAQNASKFMLKPLEFLAGMSDSDFTPEGRIAALKKKQDEAKIQMERRGPDVIMPTGGTAAHDYEVYTRQIAALQKRLAVDMKEAANSSGNPLLDAIKAQAKQLQDQREALEKMLVKDPPKNIIDKPDTGYEGVRDRLQKLITDYKALKEEQDIYTKGNQKDIFNVEGMRQATDFLTGLKDKFKSSEIPKLLKEFGRQFDAAGIATGTLVQRLADLYTKSDAARKAIADLKQQLADVPKAEQTFQEHLKGADKYLDEADTLLGKSTKSKPSIENNERVKNLWEQGIKDIQANPQVPFEAQLREMEQLWAKVQALQEKYNIINPMQDSQFAFSQAEEALADKKKALEAQVTAGIISQTEATRQLKVVSTDMGNSLAADVIPTLEKLRSSFTGNPKILAFIDEVEAKVKALQDATNNITWQQGVSRGFADYAKNIVDPFQKAHDIITELMKGIEDQIVTLVTTGKFNFNSLANSIIADIVRIVVKSYILQPFADFMSGKSSKSTVSSSGGQNTGSSILSSVFNAIGSAIFNAQGNAYNSPSLAKYLNTVVTQPTMFAFAQGIGIVGEKPGSPGEAIMPLTRTSGGDLGVKITGIPGIQTTEVSAGSPIHVSMTYVDQRQTESSMSGGEGNPNRAQDASKLMSLIKGAVIDVITREQRPGGQLAK